VALCSNWRSNWQFPRRVNAAYRPHAPITYHSFVCSHASRCARCTLGFAAPARAWPANPPPSSAIPASACTQPKPAHASLRRAGPQNAQVGAPVRAPEPGPLVETGQDCAGNLAPEGTRTQRYALHTSLHIPLRPSHDTNWQPSYKYKLCHAGAMPPACVARVGPVSSHQRLCAHWHSAAMRRNLHALTPAAKDPSSVCEPRTIHWCTFTPHVRLAGPCPR
jgi:hypothetical protein